MQVAICPRLVPELGGDEQAFIRRIDDLFVNKTEQWSYVSSNISHFKFYSTTVVWMSKKHPDLLRRVVGSITAMQKGIAVEVGIRHGHAQTKFMYLAKGLCLMEERHLRRCVFGPGVAHSRPNAIW